MSMKFLALFALIALGAAATVEKDRTITKVVKLLQGMMATSQKEGDEERVIYAKFKCYCDTSEADKTASIKSLTEQIALLENEIAEIQGSTGGLSTECAELKTKMADNEMAREEATSIREKENKAFTAEEADLDQAIKQMIEAIDTLGAVGADQTKSTGADNKQFMAGFKGSLVQLSTEVQSALRVASELMNDAQHKTTASFLQGPFTGTYSSQSAAVMGIIKQMRDTFVKNLAEARATELEQEKSYKEFMKIKEEAHRNMVKSYNEKQKELGGNDGGLSTKKGQLSEAKKQKASDEEFLESLIPLCEAKAKSYASRKVLRANEEAAIAEAVSILNSDEAFAAFGKASATSSGAGDLTFIQMRSVRRHMAGNDYAREMAKKLLAKAAKDANSARLSKMVSKLDAENPFDTVLDEITKMLEVIKEEGKEDKKNLDWCNDERKTNNADLKEKNGEILGLEEEENRLDGVINHEETGLKAQIAEQEDALAKNNEAQKTETGSRLEENVAYQKDVKALVAAEVLVAKSIKVLRAYYDDLAEKLEKGDSEAFLQEDPNPPSTWENGKFEGQSKAGDGVIGQLEFILKETHEEETEAHSGEEQAQADYEDSMTKLKSEQKKGEENLVSLQEKLAEEEKNLLDTREDLAATIKDRDAIEAYLAKIKPGCDFITENFDLREKNRGTESTALKKARTLIKATPAYKSAVNKNTVESYGDCKEPCVKDESHVECKACMADVTIPAYCAGHEGVPGC